MNGHPVEIGDDPERVALQCEGEVHGYLLRRRFLRIRCRARRCGGRGGSPVYHDFDLFELLRRLGYRIEKDER
jgi:hypothetical protein